MTTQSKITKIIRNWSHEELANLAAVCGLGPASSITEIEYELTWAYHSKVRSRIKDGALYTANKIMQTNKSPTAPECPTYEELLQGAAKLVKVDQHCESNADYELYISEAVIVAALSKMKPSDRHSFFAKEINPASMYEAAGVSEKKFTDIHVTVATLSLANMAGFGIYASATTALGFATHAAGITLPFAAYTGMTSTIAFVIGPAGWLAVGGWLFSRATATNWKVLLPALLLIIETEQRKLLRLADH